MTVYYQSGEEVLEGDHVSYTSQFFFWHRERAGRISYVPGISKHHDEMEYGGMMWVGVSGEDGTFRAVVVDGTSGTIRRSIEFNRRSDGSPYLTPDQIPPGEW